MSIQSTTSPRGPVALNGEERQQAVDASLLLRQCLDNAEGSVELTLQRGQSESATLLPRSLLALLENIFTQLGKSGTVTVNPYPSELTTQQVAELLNVSRPYVVKLLETGSLPFRKVGPRRRVALADLLIYKQSDDAYRRTVADELTREGQSLGLGYSDSSIEKRAS